MNVNEEKFKLLIIHVSNILKANGFNDYEASFNMDNLLNIQKHFLMVHCYKNNKIQTNLKNRKNHVFVDMTINERSSTKSQITIDLNYHFNQQFQIVDEEKLNNSLINLMNKIKNEIDNLNVSMLLHPQGQTTDDWNKIEMKHGERKNQHMRRQTSQSSTQIDYNQFNSLDTDDNNENEQSNQTYRPDNGTVSDKQSLYMNNNSKYFVSSAQSSSSNMIRITNTSQSSNLQPHVQYTNTNPHVRILSSSNPIPTHINPYHPGNLLSSCYSIAQNPMMNLRPTDSIQSFTSSENVSDSQEHLNDPLFMSILNKVKVPPSNANVNNQQPSPHG